MDPLFGWGHLALGLAVFAGPGAGALPPATGKQTADTRVSTGFIEELGNKDYRRRQAATRALEAVGPPALAALRAAAGKHADAEVRRQATRLVEKIENGLPQLLEDYRSYGLPLPPRDAPFVRFLVGGVNVELGFLLRPAAGKQPPEILWGMRRRRMEDDPRFTILQPTTATSREIDEWANLAVFSFEYVPLTIQCKVRGWNALAGKFFEKWAKDAAGRSPRVQLRQVAWDYWQGRLPEVDTDWHAASRYLHLLLETEPTLNTEPNQALLKSLDLALVPSRAKPGSVEALIDALVDLPSGSLEFREPGPDPRYLKLVELGFEAVPALIEHLDDARLARRRVQGWIMPWCVRHEVTLLLMGLAGDDRDADWGYPLDKAQARAWWEKAKKRGEKAQVLAQVLPKRGEWPSNQLLRVLVKKYPQELPRVYHALLDHHLKMISWPVAQALAQSNVSREHKVEVYGYACRHKNMSHRLAAFSQIKHLDHDRFVQLLVETLAGLPRTPEEEYWMCREACFARLVVDTDNLRAWRALEEAARRSDVGLRMEMLEQTTRADHLLRRKQCLAFLVAFLDDDAVRDLKADPKRFRGFPAGRDFPRLEVRNLAALHLAALLGMGTRPSPKWDPSQWADFRAAVRKRLEQ
jgi:hypothetical protein